MSDSYSFFDDPGDSHVSQTPTPESAPNADPAAGNAEATNQPISVEQFTELQRRLENSEKWRQDVGRMFMGQNPQQASQANPQQVLEQFLTDPVSVLKSTQEQAVLQAQEAYRTEAILQDRRAKHPELAQIEHLIDWQTAMQVSGQEFYKANNRHPSFAEALDGAIASVKNILPGNTNSAQQSAGGSRVVMNMDISGNGNAGNSRPVDLGSVPDADWPKMRDAYRRSHGL